jgi:hypothetical protein
VTKKCVISALFASVFFLIRSPEIRAGEPVEFAAGEILLKFKEGVAETQQHQIFDKYSLKEVKSKVALCKNDMLHHDNSLNGTCSREVNLVTIMISFLVEFFCISSKTSSTVGYLSSVFICLAFRH